MPKDRSDQAFKAVTSPGFAIFFIIGIFVLAAIPGGCYLLNFALGSGGKPSADPKDWATLGSFLSGTTGVVLSLGNFCLAAFILLWLHHRRFREEIAFAFHKEWTDLMKRRTEADAFLDKFPGDSLEVHYNAKGDGLAPVWDLIGFYERLEISVTHGRVSHELFFRLFGQIFTWWYYVAFCASPKVVVDHEARRATAAKTPTPAEANRATSAPIVGEIASVDPVNVGVNWTARKSLKTLNRYLENYVAGNSELRTELERWREIALRDLGYKMQVKQGDRKDLPAKDFPPAIPAANEGVKRFYQIVFGWESPEPEPFALTDKEGRLLGRWAHILDTEPTVPSFRVGSLDEILKRAELLKGTVERFEKPANHARITGPDENKYILWTTDTVAPKA